jgi:protein-tyrosine phosphatase
VAEEQFERWVAVEGSSNVRDLGGLPLRGGGTTASGVFYRSDTLQEWTPSDVETWRERGLGLVVDLRTPLEAEQEGRGPLVDAGEVHYLNAPLLPDEAVLSSDSELVVHDNSRDARVGRYLSYLSGDGGRNLVRAVEALAEQERPALFHCAAGKDRTGVLAAFLLEVAGVKREAVVADYALTTERLDGIKERLSRLPSYARDMADRDPSHHLAEAGTMRGLLEALDARHGGARAWLLAHGVAEETVDRLAVRLRDA